MKFRNIITLAGVGSLMAGVSTLGLGATAYAVDGTQPVQYAVSSGGSLTLSETPIATIDLVSGSAVDMPVTTVTDSRNGTIRDWATTSGASDLTGSVSGSILMANITLGVTSNAFTSGSGIDTGSSGGNIAVTGDSIGSVYTYTPTATLTAPANLAAGTYSGTITQTVL